MKNVAMGMMMLACLWLGAWSCGSDGPKPGPCDGATCSGHGSCQVTGEAGACACDPGWERDPGDALACVEIAAESFIVDLVTALSAPAGNKITVTLKTAKPVVLDMTGPAASVWFDILELQMNTQKAIAVDIDPSSRVILDLYMPIESPVAALMDTTDAVEVMLTQSAAVHYLLRSSPRFKELLGVLDAALKAGAAVLVTETDTSHEIIDVRAPIKP